MRLGRGTWLGHLRTLPANVRAHVMYLALTAYLGAALNAVLVSHHVVSWVAHVFAPFVNIEHAIIVNLRRDDVKHKKQLTPCAWGVLSRY